MACNRASCMGLGTAGVAGRPGGGCLEGAGRAANCRSRSIWVETITSISGVRFCSPSKISRDQVGSSNSHSAAGGSGRQISGRIGGRLV